MPVLVTICARGGSKGIPGKNVRELAGQPLIAYSIATARKFLELHDGDLALSTDNEHIREIAAKHGLFTDYIRPAELATDTAGKIVVLEDVLQHTEQATGKQYDYLLDLDVTSPLRSLADLQQAFEIFKANGNALSLFSVSPANRNPYFNMVEQAENGYYTTVKRPVSPFMTRQSAPRVYDMNASFYFYRRSFYEQGNKSAITDRSLIFEMKHLCFDLDHEIDFTFMEYLVTNKKLDFDL